MMTWMKASPVLAVAGIFDLIRMFFEQFWFFGPALTAAYCTSTVNDVVGTTIAAATGKVVALGCGAVAGAAGYFGSPVFTLIGVIMAMAFGLIGWLTIGLILIIANGRIFKANEYHTLWFAFSLLVSEVPIIGTLPGLSGITWKMYKTQIKKDEELMKKYEKETREAMIQERNQQAAYLMQYQAAQLAQDEIY